MPSWAPALPHHIQVPGDKEFNCCALTLPMGGSASLQLAGEAPFPRPSDPAQLCAYGQRWSPPDSHPCLTLPFSSLNLKDIAKQEPVQPRTGSHVAQ